MPFKSKALEINLRRYRFEVDVDPKYAILQEVMSKYYGIMEGFNTFLEELSHPLKNWQFIVQETKGYALDYFHLLRDNPRGPEAAQRYVDIFFEALESAPAADVRTDAVDFLLLYLLKITREAESQVSHFMPVLNAAFERIRRCDDDAFFMFLQSFYSLKRLGEAMKRHQDIPQVDFDTLNALLARNFDDTYRHWLSVVDPRQWFESQALENPGPETFDDIFNPVAHLRLIDCHRRLAELRTSASLPAGELLAQLLTLPGYNDIVEHYRRIPQELFACGTTNEERNRWKVLFLFHIMNIPGLSMIHEDTLREINRTLNWLIDHEDVAHIRNLLEKTFAILKNQTMMYPATALNCVLNIGVGIFHTDDMDLINAFMDAVIELGFQTPMISGVGNDWQIKSNQVHLQNIRTWLELIELKPRWTTRLLSSLIIYLSVCGVFIKDTDLFFRDVTQLLNSDIAPAYNLVKQLARLFPVYFNEIGAEGKLRDISTQVDEITARKDVLIHFLRKQSHVESSNRIIPFIRAVFHFWETREKANLKPFVPPDIYDRIELRGPYIDGVHRVMAHLKREGIQLSQDLMRISAQQLAASLDRLPEIDSVDRQRVVLAVEFYKLLDQKYNLDSGDLSEIISHARSENLPGIDQLEQALAETETFKKLPRLLTCMEQLQRVIFSAEVYEIREDIYKKRHFAVDIPSMYGSYREMKFNALGLTFRLESLVNVYFENLVDQIDLSLITKATFYEIHTYLELFQRALQLDGINSMEFKRQLDLLAISLEVKGFTLTQYLDIVRGFTKAVHNIIHDHFNNIHEGNLNKILQRLPRNQMLAKYRPEQGPPEVEKFKHRVSEIFFRDQIAFSLGLQQLDRFLGRMLNILFLQSEKLSVEQLRKLLLYDPKRAITSIDRPTPWSTGLIHLGAKGDNLVKLKSFGLPVPPGFIITTEVFRCREIIESYEPARRNFTEQVCGQISRLERKTGKTLGDPKQPLVLSVRSGSSISQPGMMDTFLNVGINEEVAREMALFTANPWFAWDNYRRFLQCYGMAFGLERNDFDAIIGRHKQCLGIEFKRYFSGDQMRRVALDYKGFILDSGFKVLEKPLDQLLMAIASVLDSWNSDKAKTYRRIMGISDDWGTAVTVQAMVFGNLSRRSGTGVIFTHNPRWSGDQIRLWGDFTIGNQGEDVVAGLVKTLPISLNQQSIEMRETDVILETDFPEIYKALESWVRELIHRRGWSPQEMEFTFESPRADALCVLQSRDMSIRQRQKVLTFDFEAGEKPVAIGHGIGASGGAMSGRAVFDLEEIDHWRKAEPDTALILLRNDTVPDDIREIYAADGLLTARGGVTSHASVVAHRLGKVCVVGCSTLVCNESEKYCRYGDVTVNSGEFISIDGREGSVYRHGLKIKET